ncbi:MAG: DUF3179 domain-containing protein [Pseudomonadota bacterium]
MMNRRMLLAGSTAAYLSAGQGFAQVMEEAERQMHYLVFGNATAKQTALDWMEARGQTDMAAAIIFAMRYSKASEASMSRTLQKLTGHTTARGWFDWMVWQERHPEIRPHPAFARIKRERLLHIDPQFELFLTDPYLDPSRMHIRFEEVTWGGVSKDGIPSLDTPRHIEAADADYLRADDLVFGVSINGDTRAYPLRIMGWHEMFNEVIGGVPVALAYCTLCGAGILYETKLDRFDAPLVFGSSGFLYRSNKLMFDRRTHSLWNQFTGKPVMGELWNSGIALKQRPVTITSWENWKTDNPDTVVLDLNTGHLRNYGSGVVYNRYFSSADLMFPANVDQTEHLQKDYVFRISQFGAERAWPLSVFERTPVINDKIGDRDIALFGDPTTRNVRAYERNGLTFITDQWGDISTADLKGWRLTEQALISATGEQLPRVPGHISYWFAYDNYFADAGSVYSAK